MIYIIRFNNKRARYFYICLILAVCDFSQTIAQDELNQDVIWSDYGINCVKGSPDDESLRLPIALLKNQFNNGFSYFAMDESYSYLLWRKPIDFDWYLFRERRTFADKLDKKYQSRLEQFYLTKATSTCNRLDLIFFKIPLGSYNIGPSERRLLQLTASVVPGTSEDHKGEFDDPVFYTFGLKVKISEITPGKTDFLSSLNFDRTDKILKRYSMKLPGATIDQLKSIEVISKDICEYMSTKEWIRNLPVAECIKHLQGKDSVIDQLKK